MRHGTDRMRRVAAMSHPFGVVTLWEFGDPELARDVVHA
jgi:hypothetical protein